MCGFDCVRDCGCEWLPVVVFEGLRVLLCVWFCDGLRDDCLFVVCVRVSDCLFG